CHEQLHLLLPGEPDCGDGGGKDERDEYQDVADRARRRRARRMEDGADRLCDGGVDLCYREREDLDSEDECHSLDGPQGCAMDALGFLVSRLLRSESRRLFGGSIWQPGHPSHVVDFSHVGSKGLDAHLGAELLRELDAAFLLAVDGHELWRALYRPQVAVELGLPAV